jgi:6-pyruvoyltetrahydropterin/6-carboxytetrahydropterin synthase
MIAITRCYHFAASHRLHLESLSQEQNEALYGKCNNPFGHGHNYRLEVSVTGPVHQLTGQLIPVGSLDQLVQEQVLQFFEHRYLNVDLPVFRELVATTENVLVVIAKILEHHWGSYIPGPARLFRLHIQETDRNGFETFFPVKPLAISAD